MRCSHARALCALCCVLRTRHDLLRGRDDARQRERRRRRRRRQRRQRKLRGGARALVLRRVRQRPRAAKQVRVRGGGKHEQAQQRPHGRRAARRAARL
jgi:hypothetical protein